MRARSPLGLAAAVTALSTMANAEQEAAVDAPAGADEPEQPLEPPADVRPERGFEHGARLGVGLPFGEISSGRPLSDEIERRVPIWIDIGYRLSKWWYLALFAQAGLATTGPACANGQGQASETSCAAEDFRFGLEALVNLIPPDELDVWVGVGVGWELVMNTARFVVPAEDPTGFGGDEVSIEIEEKQQGPVLELMGGIDFPVHGGFEVGPFGGYTLGTYLRQSFECPDSAGCPGDGRIDDPSLHHWATAGIRGTFGP